MSKSLDELTALDTANDSNLLYVVSEGGDRKITKANLVSGLAKDADIPVEGDFDISNLADINSKRTAWDSKLDNITGQDLSTADNTVSGFISDIAGEDLSTADNTVSGFISDIAGEDLSTADNTTAGFLSSIPTASATTLGGVKVGTNLTIADGVLSADEQGGGGQETFDCIVAGTGGDYTTIGEAITAGMKTIFVKNGTYTESAITSAVADIYIQGESRDGVSISSSAVLEFSGGRIRLFNLNFTFDGSGGLEIGGGGARVFNCNIVKTSGGTTLGFRSFSSTSGGDIIRNCYFDGTGISTADTTRLAIFGNDQIVDSCVFVSTNNGGRILMEQRGKFVNNKVTITADAGTSPAVAVGADCYVGGNYIYGDLSLVAGALQLNLRSRCVGNHIERFDVGILSLSTTTIEGNYISSCNKAIDCYTQDNITIVGNTLFNALVVGIDRVDVNTIISNNNFVNGENGIGFNAGLKRVIITGNIFGVTNDAFVSELRTSDTQFGFVVKDNMYENKDIYNPSCHSVPDQNIERLLNNSGATITSGMVVVRQVGTDIRNMTTTTLAGDFEVCGVCNESVDNGDHGIVQTAGLISNLKVDGTTNIAVGDYICTSTTAGVGQKATTGDTAYAIAQEAYTTDDANGVIDAVIIQPRKL